MLKINFIQESVFLIVILTGGATDLLYRKVYNHLTFPAIALGFALNYWFWGVSGLRSSGLGLLVGFFPLLLIFMAGGMGGGDVKLMAAIGAIMGFPFILAALLYSALTGGVIALVTVIWKKQWRTLGGDIGRAVVLIFRPSAGRDTEPEKNNRPRLTIPFGFAIFLGSLWAWVEGRFFSIQLG